MVHPYDSLYASSLLCIIFLPITILEGFNILTDTSVFPLAAVLPLKILEDEAENSAAPSSFNSNDASIGLL